MKKKRGSGEVMGISNNNIIVDLDMIKTTVKDDKGEKMKKKQIKREAPKSTYISSTTQDEIRERKLNFKQDIDLRGMRAEEALQAVTYFIDDAILVGMARVRILHGTGTGALRQIIRNYLSTVNGVRSYRDEHVQFGGAGITVVDLD